MITIRALLGGEFMLLEKCQDWVCRDEFLCVEKFKTYIFKFQQQKLSEISTGNGNFGQNNIIFVNFWVYGVKTGLDSVSECFKCP